MNERTGRYTILALALITAAVIGWTVRDNQPDYADKERAVQREFETNRARVWQERYEEEKASHITDTVIVTRERQAADSIGELLSAYRDSLPQLITTGDSLKVAMRGWMLAEIQTDRLARALEKAMVWGRIGWSLADSAAPVIQGLQEALDREVHAHQCRILFVGCPSRKAVAATAFLAGGTIALLLSR